LGLGWRRPGCATSAHRTYARATTCRINRLHLIHHTDRISGTGDDPSVLSHCESALRSTPRPWSLRHFRARHERTFEQPVVRGDLPHGEAVMECGANGAAFCCGEAALPPVALRTARCCSTARNPTRSACIESGGPGAPGPPHSTILPGATTPCCGQHKLSTDPRLPAPRRPVRTVETLLERDVVRQIHVAVFV
jgi:hypothetical protein